MSQEDGADFHIDQSGKVIFIIFVGIKLLTIYTLTKFIQMNDLEFSI
jgi:hypothetical protein